jgi:hypothetical protein
MDSPLLIGRIILGGFFIHSWVNHFIEFGVMTQYAKQAYDTFGNAAKEKALKVILTN